MDNKPVIMTTMQKQKQWHKHVIINANTVNLQIKPFWWILDKAWTRLLSWDASCKQPRGKDFLLSLPLECSYLFLPLGDAHTGKKCFHFHLHSFIYSLSFIPTAVRFSFSVFAFPSSHPCLLPSLPVSLSPDSLHCLRC